MIYHYDFHIHSALSPCAEDEMTPNNIINMAMVNGLDIIAVTDHNSVKNLPALAECAEKSPVMLLPGIEVESSEEVHISCLFSDVEAAMAMGEIVRNHLPPVKNKAEILGEQYIFDSEDNIVEKEEQMLLFSTDMTIDEIFSAAYKFGGCAYFSHVDRDSYSVLTVLGALPDSVPTGVVEVTGTSRGRRFAEERSDLLGKTILYSTDSHRLADMSRGENIIELPWEKGRFKPSDVIQWIQAKGKSNDEIMR